MSIDHDLVASLRGQVADRLNEQRRRDQMNGVAADGAEDERQYARALIVQILEDHARAEIAEGRHAPPTPRRRTPWPRPCTPRCSASAGCSRCWTTPRSRTSTSTAATRSSCSTRDGREERSPPVAETDEELVELIQVLAAYTGLSSRPFDSANPQLDLRLPDGSRLSAVMDVCAAARASRSAGPGWARSSCPTWSATARMTPEIGSVPAGRRARPARTS